MILRIEHDCSDPDTFPGGWSRRLRDERTLRVTVNGMTTDLPAAPDVLRSPKVALSPFNEIGAVAQSGGTYDGANRLMVGGAGGWLILGAACVAVDGCAIGWHGDHFDVVVQTGVSHGLRLHFRNGLTEDPTEWETLTYPGRTSFGYLSFDPSKSGQDCVRWTDSNRTFTINGKTFRLPQFFIGGVAGQYNGTNPNPDWIGGVDGNTPFSLVNDETRHRPAGAPRVSQKNGRTTIVAGLDRWDCIYFETDGEFPPFVPVPDVTSPPPPPPPEDPVFDIREQIENRRNVADFVNEKYPHLLERARREGEKFRGDYVDQLGHMLNKIDNYLFAGVPGYIPDAWGRKQKGDGSYNDDALTLKLDPNDLDKKKLVDCVIGVNFEPGWDVRPEEEEPGNGTWAPLRNPDLDKGDPVEPPPPPPPPDDEDEDEVEPPPPPPPPVDLTPLRDAIVALAERYAQQEADIDAMRGEVRKILRKAEQIVLRQESAFETSGAIKITLRPRHPKEIA